MILNNDHIVIFQQKKTRTRDFLWVTWNFSLKLLSCGALRDLVPFVQFKRREKHPWTSVTFSNAAGFSLQVY